MPARKRRSEKRWAELTTLISGGREFPDTVLEMSEPGESKADYIDRECADPKHVVRVTLTYELPLPRGD